MQIHNITNYTTRITSQTSPEHIQPLQPARNDSQDTIAISELGRRLSIRKSHKLTGGPSNVSEVASLMSKSLAKFDQTLTKMSELTRKASQDKLTALDRINMQIEYEELREELAGAENELNDGLAKLSGHKPKEPKDTPEIEVIGDNRKLLERARDRLINGEDWNIAEKWEYTGEYNEDGDFKITGGGWIRDDDEGAPTVRDKIRSSGSVDLMGSVSAKEGIERIDDELAEVRDMRDYFSSFLMGYDGEDLDNGPKLSDLPEELRTNGFDTVLGIMYENPFDNTFNLTRPSNQMGYIFVKITDMFRDVAGRLAGGVIDEGEKFPVSSESQ